MVAARLGVTHLSDWPDLPRKRPRMYLRTYRRLAQAFSQAQDEHEALECVELKVFLETVERLGS